MKNYKIIPLLFIALPFLSSSTRTLKKTNTKSESKWSGTVSYFEKKSGGEIDLSDWRMEATITNDTGTAVHTYKFRNKLGDESYCRAMAKTELDLGIDEDAGIYEISVPVPGCHGIATYHYGGTDSFGVTDETGIMINKQRLGTNHNVLSGRIRDIDGPDPAGCTTITTYEWNLRKTKN